MNKYYSGIGSRATPHDMLNMFKSLAAYLAKCNFILRSGAADGADSAFELGCDKANGKKEIYLPWRAFEGSQSNLIVQDEKAFEIAEEHHPYWHNLSEGAKKLQARNSHQVLGKDLNTPAEFIICWTVDSKKKGGTGQALRIAEHYNIPIFDCGKYKTAIAAKKPLNKFIIQFTSTK